MPFKSYRDAALSSPSQRLAFTILTLSLLSVWRPPSPCLIGIELAAITNVMPLRLFAFFTSSPEPTLDVTAVRESLKNLHESIQTLTDHVIQWNGDTLRATPLVTRSFGLIGEVKDCASVARNVTTWTHEDEDEVFKMIEDISCSLGHCIAAVMDARPKLRNIPFIGDAVTLSLIGRQRSAAAELADVLISRSRPDRCASAESLAKRIDDHFCRCVSKFSSQPGEEGQMRG